MTRVEHGGRSELGDVERDTSPSRKVHGGSQSESRRELAVRCTNPV